MAIVFGNKKFDELVEADIQKLIDGSEEESIILEFKRELGSNSKEIAKDFSAMSNSEGGIIIYGLNEDGDGKAEGFNWINSSDNFEERIENIISTTLNPPVFFKIYPINKEGDATKQVYVVLIPKSKNLHMVIKNRDNRYYKRLGKTVQLMEDSEIKERIRAIISDEEAREGLIEKLNDGMVQFGGISLNSIKKINCFIIPNELNIKTSSIDSLKTIADGLNINDYQKLPLGRAFNSYESTVVHTNYSNDNKFKSCMIFHRNGIIELRQSHDFVTVFSSSAQVEKILEFIKLSNKFYEQVGYFGGYKIYLQIGNLGDFYFNRTMSHMDGRHQVSVGSFIGGIELEPILTQTDEKNGASILELMKMLGGNLGISGDGHYANIKPLLGIV